MTTTANLEHLAEQKQADNRTILGFWIYIMTDCVLFASLFATYAVLQGNTNGGPAAKELFSLGGVLAETLILLSSSFACGLAILAAKQSRKAQVVNWLLVTALLGVAFLTIEVLEFRHLIDEGHGWGSSGFMSAFFTLVGTHGLHITAGLVWLLTLMKRIKSLGLGRLSLRQLTLFAIFWHFLDLVWIFIFTVVYLAGGLGI